MLRRAARLLLHTNLFVTAGVVGLTWYCARSEGSEPGWELVVAGAGTLLVYNLDHLRDDRRRARVGGAPPRLTTTARWSLLVVAVTALATGFVLAPPAVFLASLPSGALGLAYGAALAGRRLKDLPGAKAWIVALAVSWAVIALPAAAAGAGPADIAPELAVFVVALTTLNAHAFDLRDVPVDREMGAWTWAVRLGPDRARARMMAATVGLLAAATAWGFLAPGGASDSRVGGEVILSLVGVLGALAITRARPSREMFGMLFDGLLLVPAAWLLLS